MKQKHKGLKKHLRNKKRNLRVVSAGIIVLVGIFTGGVMLASEIMAMQMDSRLSEQEIKIYKELDELASQGIKNSSSSSIKKNEADDQVKAKPEAKTEESKPQTEPPGQESETQPQAAALPAPQAATPAPAAPAPAPVPASASLNFVNSVRAAAGKSALTENATVNQWAQAYTHTMASNCDLQHQNLNQFLGADIGVGKVSSVAENIGYNVSLNKVLEGLKNSPGHYGNMIGDYKYAGFGVVTAGPGACQGYVYTTQIFVK